MIYSIISFARTCIDGGTACILVNFRWLVVSKPLQEIFVV
jgi:hypothetical protein